MKSNTYIGMVCLCVLTAITGTTFAQTNEQLTAGTNSTALFAKINCITVLEIFADSPITDYRLLINDKIQEEKRTYENPSSHLYLATDKFEQRASIHMKIGVENCLLSAPFIMGPNNQMQIVDEQVPAKRNIAIADWTPIYRLTIKDPTKTIRCLEVQIKGSQSRPSSER